MMGSMVGRCNNQLGDPIAFLKVQLSQIVEGFSKLKSGLSCGRGHECDESHFEKHRTRSVQRLSTSPNTPWSVLNHSLVLKNGQLEIRSLVHYKKISFEMPSNKSRGETLDICLQENCDDATMLCLSIRVTGESTICSIVRWSGQIRENGITRHQAARNGWRHRISFGRGS